MKQARNARGQFVSVVRRRRRNPTQLSLPTGGPPKSMSAWVEGLRQERRRSRRKSTGATGATVTRRRKQKRVAPGQLIVRHTRGTKVFTARTKRSMGKRLTRGQYAVISMKGRPVKHQYNPGGVTSKAGIKSFLLTSGAAAVGFIACDWIFSKVQAKWPETFAGESAWVPIAAKAAIAVGLAKFGPKVIPKKYAYAVAIGAGASAIRDAIEVVKARYFAPELATATTSGLLPFENRALAGLLTHDMAGLNVDMPGGPVPGFANYYSAP